ncbi:MAG: hypothetical protein V4596_01960 [Bdellovibrionota bacterium]
MSSFTEFSKNHKEDDNNMGNNKKKPNSKVNDIGGNRLDPNTGNEREDREPVNKRNLHEANDIPQTRERSQDRNERQTSRL